jgi:hypothetical protein
MYPYVRVITIWPDSESLMGTNGCAPIALPFTYHITGFYFVQSRYVSKNYLLTVLCFINGGRMFPRIATPYATRRIPLA